jgi:hypothetical protein
MDARDPGLAWGPQRAHGPRSRQPVPKLLWAGEVVQHWDIDLFDLPTSVRAPDAAPAPAPIARPKDAGRRDPRSPERAGKVRAPLECPGIQTCQQEGRDYHESRQHRSGDRDTPAGDLLLPVRDPGTRLALDPDMPLARARSRSSAVVIDGTSGSPAASSSFCVSSSSRIS